MKIMAMITAATLSTLLSAGQPTLTPAPKTKDGKTLVVTEAERSKGTVYYTLTDRDRQVYFESNAPLEDIKGQSNKVIGYAVASAKSKGALAAGEWHLPVKSLKTGIELRDEHLAGKDWLDAASHPDVIFKITGTKDVKPVKATDAFESYSVTLVGLLSLHGVTREISIPGSTVTLLNESDATRMVAKGDLMAIRSAFTVVLKDYEVSHPVIGEKVANEVSLDVSLYLSTLPPSKQAPMDGVGG